MKHGDKITLNWLGSDVECEVIGDRAISIVVLSRLSPLEIEVERTGSKWCFFVWMDSRGDGVEPWRGDFHPTPQAALNELASRLGYKQPVPTAVAMMVDKVRCEEEGW